MIKTSNQLPDYSFIFEFSLTVCFTITMLSNYFIFYKEPKIFFLNIYYLRYLIYIISFFALVLYILYSYDYLYINKKGFFIFLLGIASIFLLFYFRRSFSFSDLMRVVILFPFIFGNKELDVKKYMKRRYFLLIIFNSLLSSFLQNVFFYEVATKRPTTRIIFNSNDPNFSAVYFFLCFLLTYKLEYNGLKYIFILLGLLTQSRNFVLGILVFYIIGYFERRPFFQKIFIKVKPIFVLILLQIAVLLFGTWFISSFERKTGRDTFSLNDQSNNSRFLYSTQGLVFLTSGKRMAVIDGAGEQYWQKGSGKGTIEVRSSLHNSFLALFVEKGIIFGIINCILLFTVINRYAKIGNYKYIYSYIFISLFLGSLVAGYYVLCLCYILAVKNYNEVS